MIYYLHHHLSMLTSYVIKYFLDTAKESFVLRRFKAKSTPLEEGNRGPSKSVKLLMILTAHQDLRTQSGRLIHKEFRMFPSGRPLILLVLSSSFLKVLYESSIALLSTSFAIKCLFRSVVLFSSSLYFNLEKRE